MTGSHIACVEGPERVLLSMFNPAFSITSVEETKQGLYVPLRVSTCSQTAVPPQVADETMEELYVSI
jgi:hypothetical protein